MEMNSRMRWYLRVQNAIYVVLVLVLFGTVAWLGEQYSIEFDWTASQRNSLTQESVDLLATLEEPVQITAWVNDDEMIRNALESLVRRYQRVKPDITLQFANPDLAPEQARAAGIRFNGTLVISYQGRTEQVSNAGEAAVSEALARLSRASETWTVFMTGHGERAIDGRANFDLGLLGTELQRQGFRVQALNLAANPLPDNTAILVIAGPRTEWLDSEVAAIREYIERGGNLLWLTDPESVVQPELLQTLLGINVAKGTVVDATTQMIGVADPTVTVVADYPAIEPVAGFRLLTLYPRAAALQVGESDWQASAILQTSANSWRETGELAGNVKLDVEDEAGPLVVGYALEKEGGTGSQRALILGDGDFVSNAFIGNQGNLDLAMNLFNWLGEQDSLLNIRIKDAPDNTLNLGRTAQIVIGFGFLVFVPLLLIALGIFIFVRRRRR